MMSADFAVPLLRPASGICSTEVRQPGLPGSGGLQQVEAGVDVGPNPLRQHLGVLRGDGGQVPRAGGWVCLPDPEQQVLL